MRKIKYIIIALLYTALINTSCSETDKFDFKYPDGIYFKNLAIDDTRDQKVIVREDTLIFSFAYELEQEYQIKIPVEIMGYTADRDREYKITTDSKSTAEAGVHYEKLKETMIMGKGVGVDTLYIKILRHRDLAENTKDLILNLEANDNFILGRKESTSITVRFSDMLEEPQWWDKWSGYMGKYHRIKHQEWIKVAIDYDIYGEKSKIPGELRTNWGSNNDIPYELMAINALKEYFIKNPRYSDETYPGEVKGERITVIGF